MDIQKLQKHIEREYKNVMNFIKLIFSNKWRLDDFEFIMEFMHEYYMRLRNGN